MRNHLFEGGDGSGHFSHSGRVGKKGGSVKSSNSLQLRAQQIDNENEFPVYDGGYIGRLLRIPGGWKFWYRDTNYSQEVKGSRIEALRQMEKYHLSLAPYKVGDKIKVRYTKNSRGEIKELEGPIVKVQKVRTTFGWMNSEKEDPNKWQFEISIPNEHATFLADESQIIKN